MIDDAVDVLLRGIFPDSDDGRRRRYSSACVVVKTELADSSGASSSGASPHQASGRCKVESRDAVQFGGTPARKPERCTARRHCACTRADEANTLRKRRGNYGPPIVRSSSKRHRSAIAGAANYIVNIRDRSPSRAGPACPTSRTGGSRRNRREY